MIRLVEMKDVALFAMGFTTGFAVCWIVTQVFQAHSASLKREITNVEKWDMWESEDGRIHAEIHRRVQQ